MYVCMYVCMYVLKIPFKPPITILFIMYSCIKTDSNDVELPFYPDDDNLIIEESICDCFKFKRTTNQV